MTEYVLARPVQIKDIEYNDMGESPLVHLGAGEGDVPCVSVLDCDMTLFVPLEDKKQQIRHDVIGFFLNAGHLVKLRLDNELTESEFRDAVDEQVGFVLALVYGEQP